MQKAGFQLESGFGSSIGEAAKTFFGRQSEVHLSGSFGKIRLGNWIPESYYTVADYGVQDQPNHDTGNFSNRLYQSVAVAGYAKLGDNWDAGLHGHYTAGAIQVAKRAKPWPRPVTKGIFGGGGCGSVTRRPTTSASGVAVPLRPRVGKTLT